MFDLARRLELERRAFGSEASETIGTMGDLATTLDEEGHSAEAEKLQRPVLAVKELAGHTQNPQ